MHILQPKHSKINEKAAEELLSKFNISKAQLPKILSTDSGLPEDCSVGDVIKITRTETDQNQPQKGEKTYTYFRVVV
ncbi:DNA-directed RNA polymerase subunit H [Candidatus Pacearchaeota archaeon]|nr:DNA-directed RNA polymerase subunit H [Candidatus Pacearchaeota archaeon]